MKTKSVAMMIATAALILAARAAGYAQAAEEHLTITVRPAQTVEQRVADEVKEKELRRAAEERLAAEENAKIAATTPRALLARARTLYIVSGTSYFEPVQLQNSLRGRPEIEDWQLTIIDAYDRREVADLFVTIDRPLFTFTFTYQVTHRATGVLLAAGKVTAFDGNAAAPKLAARILEEMRKARAGSKGRS